MESIPPVHSNLGRLEPGTPPLWTHLHHQHHHQQQQHDLRPAQPEGPRLEYPPEGGRGGWQEEVGAIFMENKREEFTEDPEADEASDHKENQPTSRVIQSDFISKQCNQYEYEVIAAYIVNWIKNKKFKKDQKNLQ